MHPKMCAIRQAPAEIGLLLEKALHLNELLEQLEPVQSHIFNDGSQHTVPPVEGLDWQIRPDFLQAAGTRFSNSRTCVKASPFRY